MEEVITSKLKGAIDDISTLIVREDGAACSGSWVIVVVAESFGPLGPLDRARKVNGILADEIKKMHAVTVSRRRDVSLFFSFSFSFDCFPKVKCWTQAQWEKNKAAYEK